MRNFTSLSAALVAAFSFGTLACGDDGDSGTTDTAPDTTADSGTPETTPETTPEETTPEETTPEEVTPTDPCDPNPCTTAPAAECVDGQVVTYEAPGTCTADGDQADCEYTGTGTACGDGEVCSGGACVAAGDACSYAFDERVSYVTHIAVGNQGDDDTCCFDFNGDGTEDNALGDLLKTAGALLQLDLNGTIREQIETGSLTLLLETVGVDDVSNDDSLDINGFYGEDGDGDLSNNASGMSTFSVDPSSFQSGTANPIIGFANAAISGGNLSAGPDLFQLSVPIVGAQLDVAVTATKLETDVALGPNGSGLSMGSGSELGGRLGGVIKRDDLYSALNAFVLTCTCIEYTDPADTMLIGADGQCNAVKPGTCDANVDGEACAQLPPLCGTLLAFIDSDVDTACIESGEYVEADCDGENDAISIGVFIKATSGTINGVLDCE